jgi:Zn-dependent protease/predicted transcriptional regulator
MFSRSITLFRIFGFAIRLHVSWIVVALVVTWSLAAGFFPARYPGLTAGAYWWMGLVGAALLFASIVIHEVVHALIARRYGMPMRGITLFVFGGIAEMEDEMPSAKSEFLMAAAGPAATIAIGFFFYALYRIAGGWPVEALGVIEYLYWVNFILAAFNLIPAFPLDGGRMLRSALWAWKGDLQQATRIATTIGSAFGIFLAGLGILQLFLGNFISAVWWFLLGMLLRTLSKAAYGQVLLKEALGGEPVSRFMKRDAVAVPPDLPIDELVEKHIYREPARILPVVTESNRLAGCITTDRLKSLRREEWPDHRVEEIMKPCSPEMTVTPDTASVEALKRMNRAGVSRLMVVEGERFVAVVRLKDVLDFLSAKLDIEGEAPRRAA